MRQLSWMFEGRFAAAADLMLAAEESQWERHAKLMHLVYVRTRLSKEDSAIEEDDFNPWLDVPGSEMPAQEKLRRENEIIAARKAAQHGQQASD